MKTFFHNSLLAVLCIMIVGNTACTSMATIDAEAEAVAANDIDAGDKVTLVYRNGTSLEITVDTIDETGIQGSDEDGRLVVADFRELEKIRARQFDGGKTARKTGKGVGYALLGILWLGAIAAEAAAGAYGG